MDARIFAALVVLSGGMMLVHIYRGVRARIDATNASASAVTTKRRLFMPRLSISFSGFDTLGVDQSEVKEAQRVLQSLYETIRVELKPGDPQSAQQAIRQFDQDIDAKIAPYRHNRMVVEFAAKLKSEYRQLLQKLERSTRERR